MILVNLEAMFHPLGNASHIYGLNCVPLQKICSRPNPGTCECGLI